MHDSFICVLLTCAHYSCTCLFVIADGAHDGGVLERAHVCMTHLYVSHSHLRVTHVHVHVS